MAARTIALGRLFWILDFDFDGYANKVICFGKFLHFHQNGYDRKWRSHLAQHPAFSHRKHLIASK